MTSSSGTHAGPKGDRAVGSCPRRTSDAGSTSRAAPSATVEPANIYHSMRPTQASVRRPPMPRAPQRPRGIGGLVRSDRATKPRLSPRVLYRSGKLKCSTGTPSTIEVSPRAMASSGSMISGACCQAGSGSLFQGGIRLRRRRGRAPSQQELRHLNVQVEAGYVC